MIPPNQGSSLFQDSSLNMTPRENCYISRYKGPNWISQDVLDREQIVYSLERGLDLEYTLVTHGSLYKFAMLNSPEISHLGKLRISPTWWIHFFSNLWGWKDDRSSYIRTKFQTNRSKNVRDIVETRSDNYAEETGEKLGLSVLGISLHQPVEKWGPSNSP